MYLLDKKTIIPRKKLTENYWATLCIVSIHSSGFLCYNIRNFLPKFWWFPHLFILYILVISISITFFSVVVVERSLASQIVSARAFLCQVSIQSKFLTLCYELMKRDFCNGNSDIILIKWYKYTRIISTLDRSKWWQCIWRALKCGIYLEICKIASLFICE